MDAMAVTFAQELSGWRAQIESGLERLGATAPRLQRLAQGATAVGTGINAHSQFAAGFCAALAQLTGCAFEPARNYFEALSSQDTAVELSGQLKVIAVSLMKIANDLRWMNSGPLAGLGEIALPALQPGSSIMPGKVNPVMAEMMNMICYQVIGNDAAVQQSVAAAQMELNVMMPVVAYNVLHAINILANGLTVFNDKALAGMEADIEKITSYVEMNTALATALNPYIGYDQAAVVAKMAFAEGKTVRQIVKEQKLLDDETLNKALNLEEMTRPREE
jgi:fumarate hydratase class II